MSREHQQNLAAQLQQKVNAVLAATHKKHKNFVSIVISAGLEVR
jgi:hypothetical protein